MYRFIFLATVEDRTDATTGQPDFDAMANMEPAAPAPHASGCAAGAGARPDASGVEGDDDYRLPAVGRRAAAYFMLVA